MHDDILIIGAGPSGLCMAAALADRGWNVSVLEQSDATSLAAPADDGREIALTHASRATLETLGLWENFLPEEVAPLQRALVIDGDEHEGLCIDPPERSTLPLGWLVPHHAIRRAAHARVAGHPAIRLLGGARVVALQAEPERLRLRLEDGREFKARLVIAADNRFSTSRRAMGIAADQYDFGKVMVVVKVRHDQPHAATAREWFRYGQTLALLPLHDPRTASAVLTLPPAEASAFMAKDAEAQAIELDRRFDHRLGRMQVLAAAHAYPLVGVYARRFVGPRFALVGDAAVGMHPVTAHGFNFGLASVQRLAGLLGDAQRQACDPGDADLLARYERGHRLATAPLYTATRLVVELFTDDRRPSRLLRKMVLGGAIRLPGFRQLVAQYLLDRGNGPFARIDRRPNEKSHPAGQDGFIGRLRRKAGE